MPTEEEIGSCPCLERRHLRCRVYRHKSYTLVTQMKFLLNIPFIPLGTNVPVAASILG
jgi:hypothetical protein